MYEAVVDRACTVTEGGHSMTGYGLARIAGVGVIGALGAYVGIVGGPTGTVLLERVFGVLNTAMLFLLVTLAYEWNSRNS